MPTDSSHTDPQLTDPVSAPALPPAIADELTSKCPVSSSADGAVLVARTQIDWYRSTPWWRLISQTVHISWRSSHLLVCLVAIGLTSASWNACILCFAPEFASQPVFGDEARAILNARTSISLLPPVNDFLQSIFIKSPWTLRKIAFTSTFVFTIVAIWGFAGGLIARRSVIEMGIRTSIGWAHAFRLVASRWRSIVWSIMMPVASIAMLALIPIVLGLVAKFGTTGQIIATIAIFPCVLLMLGIGWIVAIASLGFSISVCAIVAEKSADAFDGLSRAAAYVFQRPMTVLCILFIGTGAAAIGYWVFDFVLYAGESIFLASMSIGYGGDFPKVLSQSNEIAGEPFAIRLFLALQSMLGSLRNAYLLSFFWTASAAAYLTLRWEIDHTDFDDLDLQELGEPIAVPKLSDPPIESQ